MGVTTEHPVAAAANVPSNPLPREGGPVPFGKSKAVGEPPDVTNINRDNIAYINDTLRRYGKVGPWVLRLMAGGFLEHIFKQNPSTFSGTLMFGQASLMVLTKILRGQGAVEWLARPTAEDLKVIDTLPPQDAARLKEALLATASQELHPEDTTGAYIPQDDGSGWHPNDAKIIGELKEKNKISPTMAAWLAGAASQQIQKQQPQTIDQVKKQAQQLQAAPQPPPQAPAPQPAPGLGASIPLDNLKKIIEQAEALRSGSAAKPDYTHRYDPETNSIVAA
jgi:hypothetical protein